MLNSMEQQMWLAEAFKSDYDAEKCGRKPWIHDFFEDGHEKYFECESVNEVCEQCASFFKDSNVSPSDNKYCYSRIFQCPENMNNSLYTPGDCGLSQCSDKCTTDKMKTSKYNRYKEAEIHEHTNTETSCTVSRDEPHENDHVIHSEKQQSPHQVLEKLYSNLKSEKEIAGKLSLSVMKSKLASMKANTSLDHGTSVTEQASLCRLNSTRAPLKLKLLKQSSGSVSILKSSANIKNQRVLQQLQPSAVGNCKQIRNTLHLPKQLESDGDSISPRSESPQSYNGNSSEEQGLDQDNIKLKLGIVSGDQLWWPSHCLKKTYKRYSEQVTRQQCAREEDIVKLKNNVFPINHIDLDHSYHSTGEKKDSHLEWNQSMTDSSESGKKSEIDVVSDKPDRNWARQQESSFVSNAQLMAPVNNDQLMAPVNNDQLMAPVSTAQPTELVRRSSRIQKSENRKRSREDLSPQDLPEKRTKLRKEHSVKKIYGAKKVNNKDTTLTKRECHNQNERNRRYGIKNNLSNLQRLIPKFANRSKPPTKQETLDAATKYLFEQERENRDWMRQREELQKKRNNLIEERGKLKQRCLVLGISYHNELLFGR